jgi:hypothetical protein
LGSGKVDERALLGTAVTNSGQVVALLALRLPPLAVTSCSRIWRTLSRC